MRAHLLILPKWPKACSSIIFSGANKIMGLFLLGIFSPVALYCAFVCSLPPQLGLFSQAAAAEGLALR